MKSQAEFSLLDHVSNDSYSNRNYRKKHGRGTYLCSKVRSKISGPYCEPARGWTPLHSGFCGGSPPPVFGLDALNLPPRPPSCWRTVSTAALRPLHRTTNPISPSLSLRESLGPEIVLVVRCYRSDGGPRARRFRLGAQSAHPRWAVDGPRCFASGSAERAS